MSIKELASMLDIPKEYVDNEQLDFEMEMLSKEYERAREKVISYLKCKNNSQEAFLYLILHLALKAKENYKKAGISEEIWADTMTDIRVWQKDYEKKYQKSGITEPLWVLKTVDMSIFKLGSLQFEKIKLLEDVQLNGKALKKASFVLDTHIQEATDFSPEKVEASYEMAKEFFGINIFVCESWLLSPILKELLEKNSNILSFQSKYQIIEQTLPHTQMEERVYCNYKENKLDYQELTKLQKNLKSYLLKGKLAGIAKGYYLREK